MNVGLKSHRTVFIPALLLLATLNKLLLTSLRFTYGDISNNYLIPKFLINGEYYLRFSHECLSYHSE